jgi:dihydroorotate dehydrogenase (fumarate)
MNTETNYLGLRLKNPVIAGSSGLTGNIAGLEKIAKAGAGAIVLKSIFEEQIIMESEMVARGSSYPEAEDYISTYTKNHALDQYLRLIEEAKAKIDIPIIGSINCISSSNWTSFALNMQQAGVDSLELNVFFVPKNLRESNNEFEDLYERIVSSIIKKVNIPVSVKIGQNFTQLPAFVNSIASQGAKGIVMFNRFYAPDINIQNLSLTHAEVFSNPADIRDSMRWVGIISALIPSIDICASTGIHNSSGVIKQILSGAKAVQVCSALYKSGVDHIRTIIIDLEEWMTTHNFSSIDEFRGRMNYKNIPDPMIFERVQFMKYYSDLN